MGVQQSEARIGVGVNMAADGHENLGLTDAATAADYLANRPGGPVFAFLKFTRGQSAVLGQ